MIWIKGGHEIAYVRVRRGILGRCVFRVGREVEYEVRREWDLSDERRRIFDRGQQECDAECCQPEESVRRFHPSKSRAILESNDMTQEKNLLARFPKQRP